jgi:pre-mRNA-processing factor 6
MGGHPEGGRSHAEETKEREERSYVVPDSVIVEDKGKGDYENASDPSHQETGGFETSADSGQMTRLVELKVGFCPSNLIKCASLF